MDDPATNTALSIRSNWFVRVVRATPLFRALLPVEAPTEFRAGSDYLTNATQPPGYPARGAMSAMGAFPWVVACASAISIDLSSLPIRAMSGGQRVDDHPILDLLSKPSERTRGINFLRQWVTDFLLVGWAPVLILENPGDGQHEARVRMLPARTKISATGIGEPNLFIYDEQGRNTAYDYKSVVCPRSPSFEDGPNSVYGEGAIRALHRDLMADLSAQELAERSAKTGRPSAVATPAGGSGVERWNSKQIKSIKDALSKLQNDSHGGIAVLNGLVDISPLGWSPRDMEFGESRKLTRETVLASFHCPPSRVGLPTANYATQKQQMATYWEHLQGIAALFASELSRLGSRFADPVTVEFDFSGVQALQGQRTERLQRVSQHIMNGVTPSDAYRFEGFDSLSDRVADFAFEQAEQNRNTVITALESNDPIDSSTRSQLASLLRGVCR